MKPSTRAKLETFGILRPKDAGPPLSWWVYAGLAMAAGIVGVLWLIAPGVHDYRDRVGVFLLFGGALLSGFLALRLRKKSD